MLTVILHINVLIMIVINGWHTLCVQFILPEHTFIFYQDVSIHELYLCHGSPGY